MMIVQPNEFNIYDQNGVTNYLKRYNINLVRYTLSDVFQLGHLDSQNRLYMNQDEIAIVYFRAAYTPRDFVSNNEWSARLMIESSFAIKCPTIALQIAGMKIVQQAIADTDVLSRFLDSQSQVDLVQKTFTGLYPLDESLNGIEAYQNALKNPENYVMKPQREGGGNNLYGKDLVDKLTILTPLERQAYILMDKLTPHPSSNIIVTNNKMKQALVTNELGIFGFIISNGDSVLYNEENGHLLRTKEAISSEGGLAVGTGALDTPNLV
jgi:glutathione synthetase